MAKLLFWLIGILLTAQVLKHFIVPSKDNAESSAQVSTFSNVSYSVSNNVSSKIDNIVYTIDNSSITKVKHVIVTAYTAAADECGHSHGITKSGQKVRHGGVACNFLPLGAKLRIPKLFGDLVFEVNDRLSSSRDDEFQVDVYVTHKKLARSIGNSRHTVEVIN